MIRKHPHLDIRYGLTNSSCKLDFHSFTSHTIHQVMKIFAISQLLSISHSRQARKTLVVIQIKTLQIEMSQNSSLFSPDYSAQFLDSMNESKKSSWTQQTESLRFVKLSVSLTKSNRQCLTIGLCPWNWQLHKSKQLCLLWSKSQVGCTLSRIPGRRMRKGSRYRNWGLSLNSGDTCSFWTEPSRLSIHGATPSSSRRNRNKNGLDGPSLRITTTPGNFVCIQRDVFCLGWYSDLT